MSKQISLGIGMDNISEATALRDVITARMSEPACDFLVTFACVCDISLRTANMLAAHESSLGDISTVMADQLYAVYGCGMLGMGADPDLASAALKAYMLAMSKIDRAADAWVDALVKAGASSEEARELSQGGSLTAYLNKNLSLRKEIAFVNDFNHG